jgi:hypothetical protein
VAVGVYKGWLQVLEEAVILGMRADPEPGDLVTLQEPECTVTRTE